MKFKRLSIGTLGLLAVSGFAWSCSSKSDDCAANLNCAAYDGPAAGTSGSASASGTSGASGMSGKGGASGTSGTSGGSGTSGEGGTDPVAGSGGAPPPTCDGTLSPDADNCVISDEYGVFVSPTGDDATADGTQAHPYATVTSALAAIGKIKHVYVCAGDNPYAEPGTLEIPDRVSIYGGFSCADGNWSYDAPLPAYLKVESPIGAIITGAKVGVAIQDLRIDAANAPDDGSGASSFGLMVNGSAGIALKRVEIHAGKGGKGKAGADGVNGVDGAPSTDAQNGLAGSCTSPPSVQDGPHAVPRQCESEGGNGGAARVATAYASSQDGGSGYLVTPSNGGKGGDVVGQAATRGQDGSQGARGDTGAAAPSIGTFSLTGYSVASGGSGMPGKAGQGGGGGGASLGTATCIGATGGAGGMGGCGGDPGTGGTGGGASVAMLSWQSTVSLDACKLVANMGGAGGDAGKGHIGGAGKAGGVGGTRDKDANVGEGGDGGKGGSGGNGGNGAGGTGGPSIALVYDGTSVAQLTPSVLNFAPMASAAGKGGTLGQANNYGPDGSKGLTQDIYPKPATLP